MFCHSGITLRHRQGAASVAVVLCQVTVAVAAIYTQSVMTSRRELESAAVFESFGGRICLEGGVDALGLYEARPVGFADSLCRRFTGGYLLRHTAHADITFSEYTTARRPIHDRDLAILRTLKELRSIDLSRSEIRGECLENLEQLEIVVLDDTRLDDFGMQVIARMKRLRSLSVANSLVTDRGIVALRKCEALKELNLAHNHNSKQFTMSSEQH